MIQCSTMVDSKVNLVPSQLQTRLSTNTGTSLSSPYLPLLSSPPLFLTLFTYRVDASPRGGPNFNMSLGSQVAKLVLAEAEQSEKALEQIFGDLLVWEERGAKR